MRAFEPGEAVLQLPWLSPGRAALVRMARSANPSLWSQLRLDPGAVLLLVRTLPSESAPNLATLEAAFRSADLLDLARQNLCAQSTGYVDWSNPNIQPVYQASVNFARLAWLLAQRIGCDPVCAWIGGLLAPLGWLAIGAVDADAAGECLSRLGRGPHLPEMQRQLWGHDAPAIARRLARRWQLPLWLHAIVGYLALPTEHADSLGAEERLFAMVQWAVTMGQTHGHNLGLAVGTDLDRLHAWLGLSTEDVTAIQNAWEQLVEAELAPDHWPDPSAEPLLPELLAAAAESRRRQANSFTDRLECEIDWLHQQLSEQKATEVERLGRSKIRALAEFAAGAGHEINNPLAVISGQSQYLLAREQDPSRQKALNVIVAQAERIHQLLNDLMQFARPPSPRRQDADLRPLLAEVISGLQALADEKTCRWEYLEPADPVLIHADARMIQTSLRCLLRNALEAVPRDGLIQVQVERGNESVQVAIVDSGPGPNVHQREHLFDPFFSGRRAGRGRGLGLPTAWRMARENGGDVQYVPLPEFPARFVLTLPALSPLSQPVNSHEETLAERKIA